MKYLKNPTKCDMLVTLFDKVGKEVSVEDVLAITGVVNANSLKSLFSHIRRTKNVADGSRIDVRIREGACTRIG